MPRRENALRLACGRYLLAGSDTAAMREIVPDVSIRTTFIVGFPGEGEAEFQELCEFVRGAELDNVGAFAYSPEPGSASEPLGDPVPAEEKERRRDFLLSIQRPIARKKNRKLSRKKRLPSRNSPLPETSIERRPADNRHLLPAMSGSDSGKARVPHIASPRRDLPPAYPPFRLR